MGATIFVVVAVLTLGQSLRVVILTKLSSLAAFKVVILTTCSAASEKYLIKMTIFSRQCCQFMRGVHQSDHYSDVTMNATASQITGVSIIYSTGCSGADQRKNQSSASLAFVRGIHRSPVNSPHKGWGTRKMFLFDDVIIILLYSSHVLMFIIYHTTHNKVYPNLIL